MAASTALWNAVHRGRVAVGTSTSGTVAATATATSIGGDGGSAEEWHHCHHGASGIFRLQDSDSDWSWPLAGAVRALMSLVVAAGVMPAKGRRDPRCAGGQ